MEKCVLTNATEKKPMQHSDFSVINAPFSSHRQISSRNKKHKIVTTKSSPSFSHAADISNPWVKFFLMWTNPWVKFVLACPVQTHRPGRNSTTQFKG